MFSIFISRDAYLILLEWSRRHRCTLTEAVDQLTRGVRFPDLETPSEALPPAPLSPSRSQLAELAARRAQEQALEQGWVLSLVGIDGCEQRQFVEFALRLSSAQEQRGDAPSDVRVSMTFAELDAPPTPYALGTILFQRALETLSAAFDDSEENPVALEMERRRGRPRKGE